MIAGVAVSKTYQLKATMENKLDWYCSITPDYMRQE